MGRRRGGESRIRRLVRWFARIEQYSDRWWYHLAIALFAALDLFIVVVPTEGILVTTVLMRPRRWILTFLWISFGCGMGALGMASLMRHFGEPMLQVFFSSTMQTETWSEILGLIERYGTEGLLLIALGPFPQAPAVAFCGLTHMPLANIFFCIFIGRSVKYGLLAWITLHSPKLIRRLRGVYREVDEVVQANKPPE